MQWQIIQGAKFMNKKCSSADYDNDNTNSNIQTGFVIYTTHPIYSTNNPKKTKASLHLTFSHFQFVFSHSSHNFLVFIHPIHFHLVNYTAV